MDSILHLHAIFGGTMPLHGGGPAGRRKMLVFLLLSRTVALKLLRWPFLGSHIWMTHLPDNCGIWLKQWTGDLCHCHSVCIYSAIATTPNVVRCTVLVIVDADSDLSANVLQWWKFLAIVCFCRKYAQSN